MQSKGAPKPGAPKPEAPTSKITVSPFELARGQIALTKSPPTKIDDCDLNAGVFQREKCHALAALTKDKKLGNVAVSLEEGDALKGTFTLAGNTIQISTSPVMTSIAIPRSSGWVEVSLANGATTDHVAFEAFRIREPHGMYGLDAQDKLYALTLSLAAPPGDSGPTCVSEASSEWCKAASTYDKLICIDAIKGFEQVMFEPRKHILAPNAPVSVVVRHLVTQGIEIKQQGQRGLFEASVADYTGKFFKLDMIRGAMANGIPAAFPPAPAGSSGAYGLPPTSTVSSSAVDSRRMATAGFPAVRSTCSERRLPTESLSPCPSRRSIWAPESTCRPLASAPCGCAPR